MRYHGLLPLARLSHTRRRLCHDRRVRRAGLCLVLALVALGAGGEALPVARAAHTAVNLTGTWIGQDQGVYVIKQAGTTVTWFAHSADNKTWAHDFKGTVEGSYVVGTFKDRPGYGNRYQGPLVVRIVDNNHMVLAHSYNGVTSVLILTHSWTRQTPGGAASGPAPLGAMPAWVHQMINDFNLGISQPSGYLRETNLRYQECKQGAAAAPPDYTYIDGWLKTYTSVIETDFRSFSKFPPLWIDQIRKLPASPATTDAVARLQAVENLHGEELDAWAATFTALGRHECAASLGFLQRAAQAGAEGWADGYTGVRDIAALFGQGGSVSHQTPYAQKLG